VLLHTCILASGTKTLLGRRLLILLWLLGQFDGEEGLHTSVEIEHFAGPAGSDGLGVGMVEAVHRRKPNISRLLLSAGEVEMARQALVVDPGIALLPVGFGKHPSVTVTLNRDAALMNDGVMPATEQDQIANTALRVPSSDLLPAPNPIRRPRQET
jgi:hypothetical protein